MTPQDETPWCASCKESDCCVSLDGTCAMIRKYLSASEIIEEMEIRQAAMMLHSQTIVDFANAMRETLKGAQRMMRKALPIIEREDPDGFALQFGEWLDAINETLERTAP